MANVLPREKRIAVLRALVNGNSERAASDMAEVNARTVARLAAEFGLGASRVHDQIARDLTCAEIECDEIFSFVGKKQAKVKPDDPQGVGEAYTYVAIDRASRFVISIHVGKRDAASTNAFVADLRARLVVMPEISTDGFAAYPAAVGAEFGPSVDYGTMVKNYSSRGRRDDDHRYAPVRGVDFITKRTVYGAPNLDRTSTAHVERNNLTMRHTIGRIRRLCLAFSKRFDRHCHAVALGYVWYNLGVIVKGLRMTPAMSLGVTDHLWTIEEFHDAVTEAARTPQDKPEKKPLAHRKPEGPARELPGGRGWLRVVSSGNAPPPSPAPATPPPEPVAAPAAAAAPSGLRFEPNGQGDLFSWTPPRLRPAPVAGEQLSLFPDA